MADAQLKLSRRALLGVACTAPLLGLSEGDFLGLVRTPPRRDLSVTFGAAAPLPGTAARLRSDAAAESGLRREGGWSRALARFRRAEAAVAALEGTSDDDAFNAAADALDTALKRLLRTPAPGLPALAAKIDLAIAHQAWELRTGSACMAALAEDAHRLS